MLCESDFERGFEQRNGSAKFQSGAFELNLAISDLKNIRALFGVLKTLFLDLAFVALSQTHFV